MPRTLRAPALVLTAALCLAPVGMCVGEAVIEQELIHQAGFVQADTPGAPGAPPASAAVTALLGPDPDLNRVTTLRTRIARPGGAPPRVVLILMPGFLGGAASLEPLARELVDRFNGEMEVWVVDRRPNQLEDRLGTAAALATFPSAEPGNPTAFVDAVQFYFPDENNGDPAFPEDGDFDVDDDGVLDPPFTLTDGFGVERSAVRFAQDDLRFLAHWGLDTYARDWKLLVDEARARVGEQGLVLFGGHSMGTGWTARFAAYDFDPGPGVDASYTHLDGLLLLEGGGAGAPPAEPTSRDDYLASVADLASPGGPDVFLSQFSGIDIPSLGAAAELAGVAGFHRPDEPAVVQRTPIFGAFPLGIVLGSPSSNETVIGLFIDDDFSSVGAFRASVGFTSNGPNVIQPGLFGGPPFYLAAPATSDPLRLWQNIDDPGLPTCPPNDPAVSPGCALQDGQLEVTDMAEFLKLQFGSSNFVEWYFVDGRVDLDFSYGRDSSSLGDESLLAITQNANVDVPVLAIGGSNGLTPTPDSFADYLGSIATPAEDKEVVILDGYAHLDVGTATGNATVPVVADWVNRLLARKLGL